MPTYKVKPEPDYSCPMPVEAKKKKRYPTVCIPVSKEILDELSVDGKVEVTLTGFVRGLESRQSSGSDPWGNKDELRMELRLVDATAAEGSEDDEHEEQEPNMKDAIDKGLGYSKK